ncbi:lytic polysaccharide monooxygenase [Trematosphaeria pertusa]|uniref:lytic cellulose monooxygenase (C4-dehydrogenating) n=1 Tax=Trematosphaeria pertusa TaxID=390896 RepID=A0A6A6IEW7_9PLEO|nr:lytic polysaccharide monooxygenase [Trematosphaeria pertusa]KAF2249124.1 lytic polysaccharide monooxygenase [Trematosphaeria pertusa]
MRILTIALSLLSCQYADAHYVFSKLSHNGGPLSAPWQYIRNVTDGWAYSPTNGYTGDFVPYYDMYDANIRCGRGAARSGPGTQTLTVNAGDELAFFPTIRDQYSNEEKDTDISHEGPGQAYLSKAGDAEGELEAYEGDGDWFKIGSIIAKNETRWALLSAASYSYRFNNTQFYVNCAHIDVKGPGGGNPGPMAKFPGAYDVWDNAIWAPYHVAELKPWNLTGYVAPGPAVWSA